MRERLNYGLPTFVLRFRSFIGDYDSDLQTLFRLDRDHIPFSEKCIANN